MIKLFAQIPPAVTLRLWFPLTPHSTEVSAATRPGFPLTPHFSEVSAATLRTAFSINTSLQ